jgi:hypothetical protein
MAAGRLMLKQINEYVRRCESFAFETALENNLFLLHNDTDFDRIRKVIKDLQIY